MFLAVHVVYVKACLDYTIFYKLFSRSFFFSLVIQIERTFLKNHGPLMGDVADPG